MSHHGIENCPQPLLPFPGAIHACTCLTQHSFLNLLIYPTLSNSRVRCCTRDKSRKPRTGRNAPSRSILYKGRKKRGSRLALHYALGGGKAWERLPRGNGISVGPGGQAGSPRAQERKTSSLLDVNSMNRAGEGEQDIYLSSWCLGLVLWNGERGMRSELGLRQYKTGLTVMLRMGSFVLWVTRIHHRFPDNNMP